MAPLPDSHPGGGRKLLLAAIGILTLQGALAYSLSLNEYLPSPPALTQFPAAEGSWRAVGETAMEPDAYAMLAPDDYLNRVYRNASGTDLGLFIAYYKSQHRAAGAHDPKICLPGSGWNPVSSRPIQIRAAGAVVSATQYTVAKGSLTDVVVYWFQTAQGSLGDTEGLHMRRIVQTFTEHRTDMALVRVTAPVENGDTAGGHKVRGRFRRRRVRRYRAPVSAQTINRGA